MQKKPRFGFRFCSAKTGLTGPDQFKNFGPQYKQKMLSSRAASLSSLQFTLHCANPKPKHFNLSSHYSKPLAVPPPRPLPSPASAKVAPVPEHPQPVHSRFFTSPSPLSTLLRLRKVENINTDRRSMFPQSQLDQNSLCFHQTDGSSTSQNQ